MAVKTTSDIQIENTSYTSKDFSQIYPELVDLAKTITNKWDPETTNEGDPGLVLLKLLAFIGDKNNYNIDKNILEQFMPSVTQETSMRNLCDMMGYNVGYYRSSIAEVTFSYLGGNETIDNLLNSGTYDIHLKAFDTSFKTEDNIVYTLIEDIEITSSARVDTKRAIQGQMKALNLSSDSVTSSSATKIQLYNLDENNRIYIPDIMVAENGIFINKEVYDENLNDDAWRRVDNLNDQELGSKVFKFGFDSSRDLPYIEFPSDITDLIGDGLEIYYVVSDGVNGYAKSGTLTSFNSFSFDIDGVTSLEDNQYTLTNATSTSAADPETIDEAYKNFRKTIGTFDTLVSCKDYTNYIYRYQDDETNNYVVSNVQAMDIRTDPNRSINLLTRDLNGMSYYVTSVKKDDTGNIIGTYNDLILHGTRPYNYDIYNKFNYNDTYTLLNAEDINNIAGYLEYVKTLSHILEKPKNEEIALIEQRYTLNVNISTIYKVNKTEQTSILSNVRNALYNNFNAREVEFGEEIPYDEIVSVIEKADERIKLAIVDDPIITPWIVRGDGSSTEFLPKADSAGDSQKILIENILGGRIQLYIKDDSLDFDYDMNLSTLKSYKNLAAIKTGLTLNIPASESVGYKLKKNESIQVIEDSYIPSVTYPGFVYFGVKSNNITTVDGVPYELKGDEVLYIYYTDTNDVVQIKKYSALTENKIFKTNGFSLPVSQDRVASRWLDINTNQIFSENGSNRIPMYALGTNETIEILGLNKVTLSNSTQLCFWYNRPIIKKTGATYEILNQAEDDLVFYRDGETNTYYHILEEDELFIYPSDDGYALYSVGSGTKLQVTINNTGKLNPFSNGDSLYGAGTIYLSRQNTSNVINLEDLVNAINSQDVNNFKASYDFNELDFRENKLEIIETNITTFIENDEVKSLGKGLSITSEWSSLSSGIASSSITKNVGSITNPKIRALLSLSVSSSNPQLVESEEQKVDIIYYSGGIDEDGYYDASVEEPVAPSTVSVTQGQYIQVNGVINDYKDVILRAMHYEEDATSLVFRKRYEVPYTALVYVTYQTPQAGTDGGYSLYQLITAKGLKKSTPRNEYSFIWNELKPKLTADYKLTISVPSNLNVYINYFDSVVGRTTLVSNNESDKIEIDLSYLKGQLTDSSDAVIIISTPVVLDINPLLLNEIGQSAVDTILDDIKENYQTFDYLAELSNSKLISSYNLVNSFFDYNNVYNPLTIGKINFDESYGSKFNIVASSRK